MTNISIITYDQSSFSQKQTSLMPPSSPNNKVSIRAFLTSYYFNNDSLEKFQRLKSGH